MDHANITQLSQPWTCIQVGWLPTKYVEHFLQAACLSMP